MKKLTLFAVLFLLVSSVAGLAVRPAAAQGGALWTVEYYNNMSLSGSPAYTTQSPTVGFNWTDTPLAPGVNADFFSARWTSSQPLNPGHYLISTRADDGVRVWVAGTLLIDRFAVSTGQTYTTTFYTGGGQVPIVVEYYEGTGVAFLSFVLEAIAPPTPTPALPPSGAMLTVLSYGLNVRNAPSVEIGAIITQIARGQTYPIIGRNADSSWWQISIPAFAQPGVHGIIGWVSGAYVSAVNTQNVPITWTGPSTPTPPVTIIMATARVNLNIRSGPGISYGVVGWLPAGMSAQVIGRNAESTWWQIRTNTVTGWVSAPYTTLSPGADINQIPITQTTPPPPQPGVYSLTANVNLNIRSGPAVIYPVVGWLPIGASAQIVGRSATTTWYQIRYNAVTGWVNGSYTTLQPGTDLNLIPITG
ncbi:MAG: SH3 domain-containing protein [Chloroflexi bacterium]|nr:SH3 domain-containing protein [Chloroflexota bacterium]